MGWCGAAERGADGAFLEGAVQRRVADPTFAEHRLARGNATGAFAVMTTGDWEGLPTRDELALLDLDRGSTLR
jgi:2-dehydro-3-deoxygluconokinase